MATKYENVWESLVSVFADHFYEHIKLSPLYNKMDINTTLTKSVSHGFLSGLLYILRSCPESEKKLENVTDFCMIYFVGMLDLLKDNEK